MPEPLESLSATGWYEALTDAGRVLADHAGALDEMDGHGVGSDLAATLSGALAAVEGTGDLASVSAALTEGARQAASGTAGRRLASVLEGMGESLRNADAVDAERFALALEAAAELLASSHDGRRPGRFAAVASEAADAALSACDSGASLPDAVLASATAGIEELERGPESDPVLAERGTVDPAGAGLLLILDSLASVVCGEPLPQRPTRAEPTATPMVEVPHYDVSCRLIPDTGGVEFAASLKEVLAELGEVTEWDTSGDSWTVRAVTSLPGAAVEAMLEIGRPRDLRIAVRGEAGASGASGEAAGARPRPAAVG
jgi:dihydroxyacetone kinase-like predicted kinase